jgi:nucleoside-diphosphate-sugar epimerase
VVTGAAGFIGSHLCERLVGDGWRVTGVDCFTNYYAREDKLSNLEGLTRAPAFDLLEREGVAATPGIDFGSNGTKRYVRFAYTRSMADLEEAARRLKRYCG